MSDGFSEFDRGRVVQAQNHVSALDIKDLNHAADHLRKIRMDTAEYANRTTAIHKAIDAAAHIPNATAKDIVTLTTFFFHFMTNTIAVARETNGAEGA